MRAGSPAWSPVRIPRHRIAMVVMVLSLALSTTAGCGAWGSRQDSGPGPDGEGQGRDDQPFRAFTADSWWNTPLPTDAPSHHRAEDVLQYMRTAEESGGGCLRLAGAEDNPWGQPVYWAQPGDPEYDLNVDIADDPPELRALRIPRGAEPAPNGDDSMTVFDVERGYVVALTAAEYDADRDEWSAGGATVTYLDSDGLHARTGRASDSRNLGSHRGNNGAVMMVRLDEVEAGRIRHVLKVASGPETSTRFVFPMVGSDGWSSNPAAPPQGLRFRIKPSVDLDALGLEPQARVIAAALQRYGFYIGDSGGVTTLKLEDTPTEGRGDGWSITSDALCGLPFTARYWDVLPAGYEPPA
jgi:hypothetical protein